MAKTKIYTAVAALLIMGTAMEIWRRDHTSLIGDIQTLQERLSRTERSQTEQARAFSNRANRLMEENASLKAKAENEHHEEIRKVEQQGARGEVKKNDLEQDRKRASRAIDILIAQKAANPYHTQITGEELGEQGQQAYAEILTLGKPAVAALEDRLFKKANPPLDAVTKDGLARLWCQLARQAVLADPQGYTDRLLAEHDTGNALQQAGIYTDYLVSSLRKEDDLAKIEPLQKAVQSTALQALQTSSSAQEIEQSIRLLAPDIQTMSTAGNAIRRIPISNSENASLPVALANLYWKWGRMDSQNRPEAIEKLKGMNTEFPNLDPEDLKVSLEPLIRDLEKGHP